jgi:hypothetical protein
MGGFVNLLCTLDQQEWVMPCRDRVDTSSLVGSSCADYCMQLIPVPFTCGNLDRSQRGESHFHGVGILEHLLQDCKIESM